MKKYRLFLIVFLVFLSSYTIIAQDGNGTKKDKIINLGGVEINLSTAASTSKVINFIKLITNAEISEIDSVLKNLKTAEKDASDYFTEKLPDSIHSKYRNLSLESIRIVVNDKEEYLPSIPNLVLFSLGLTDANYKLIKSEEKKLREKFDKNKNKIVADTLSNRIKPKIDKDVIFKIVEAVVQIKRISGKKNFFDELYFLDNKPSVQISLGANFDFINGLNTNAVYAEVSGFPTEIWRPWEKEFDDFGRFGLDIGLLNYRSISRTDSIINLRPDTLFIPISNVDTQKKRIVNNAEKVYESSQENLGVYFSPTFKLTKYLYFALHTEYRKIDVTQTIFNNIIESDTIIVNKKELSLDEKNKKPTNTTQRLENKFTKNETQLGGGILVFIDDNPFKLKIKFVVGYQIVTRRNRPKEEVFFHNLNFSLIESNLGIKFGGQLRGEFFSGKPEFSVYLAKEFPVSKLLDFLGPN